MEATKEITQEQARELLEALKDIVVDLQFSDVQTHKNLTEMANSVIAKVEGK